MHNKNTPHRTQHKPELWGQYLQPTNIPEDSVLHRLARVVAPLSQQIRDIALVHPLLSQAGLKEVRGSLPLHSPQAAQVGLLPRLIRWPSVGASRVPSDPPQLCDCIQVAQVIISVEQARHLKLVRHSHVSLEVLHTL